MKIEIIMVSLATKVLPFRVMLCKRAWRKGGNKER